MSSATDSYMDRIRELEDLLAVALMENERLYAVIEEYEMDVVSHKVQLDLMVKDRTYSL